MISGFNHSTSTENVQDNKKPLILEVENGVVLCNYINGIYIPIGGVLDGGKYVSGLGTIYGVDITEIGLSFDILFSGASIPIGKEQAQTIFENAIIYSRPIMLREYDASIYRYKYITFFPDEFQNPTFKLIATSPQYGSVVVTINTNEGTLIGNSSI